MQFNVGDIIQLKWNKDLCGYVVAIVDGHVVAVQWFGAPLGQLGYRLPELLQKVEGT
jgi:hypothetical protein